MKLAIEKIIYGGQGLARIPAESGPQSGMRIFVPFTLPGELVEAEIAEEHRGYCVGDVRQIERASEYRTSPPCPWFGICGGCQLQHGAYAYQVQLKREILAESLTRAGIRDLPEISTLSGRAVCLSQPRPPAGPDAAGVCHWVSPGEIASHNSNRSLPHRFAAAATLHRGGAKRWGCEPKFPWTRRR